MLIGLESSPDGKLTWCSYHLNLERSGTDPLIFLNCNDYMNPLYYGKKDFQVADSNVETVVLL